MGQVGECEGVECVSVSVCVCGLERACEPMVSGWVHVSFQRVRYVLLGGVKCA